MDSPPIILASQSPRREQLLLQLELNFTVVTRPTDESTSEHLTPMELCQINAYRKAWVVAKAYPDHLVIGADTIVCLGSKVYGKPRDLNEAREMLSELQGHTHEVLTGVCLIHLRHHRDHVFAESTEVTFRNLDEIIIRNYLKLIDPLDKAGSYALQDHGDMIVEKVNGSASNVIGLPLERLYRELSHWGYTQE